MKTSIALGFIILVTAGAAFAQPASTTNSIGMELVLIKPGMMQVGVFKPGCPAPLGPPRAPGANAANPGPPRQAPPAGASAAIPGRSPSDPRNQWTAEDMATCEKLVAADRSEGFPVTIPKPYYIGKYEVTQRQWKAVMGTNPSTFQGKRVPDDGDDHPVENVSWADAQLFVKKLNAREKTKAYRLPSEFEWEYACRAGGPGQQSWDEITSTASMTTGFGTQPKPPRAGTPNYSSTTTAVGVRQPNAWGLYDMLGNVWEWTADTYNGKLFQDPKPGRTGREHVLKGGGFAANIKNAICATHGGGPGDGWDVGFRIVKAVD